MYCEEGLNLRIKRPRRQVAAANWLGPPELMCVDQCCSMNLWPIVCLSNPLTVASEMNV